MRATPPILLVLLAPLAFVGCGSGGEAGSTAAPDEGPAPATTTGTPKQERRVGPLEVSDGGSAQFRIKGGDNSIANYGSEASSEELREAAELVHGYFAALATEQWSEVCSALSSKVEANVEELAARSPKVKGKGCAPGLAVLFGKVSPVEGRQVSAVDAEALRRQGPQGFLLYRGAEGQPYFMSVVREGGGWAVAGLSPAELG